MKTLLGKKYKRYHLEEMMSAGKKAMRFRVVLTEDDGSDNQVDFILTREDGKYVGADLNKYPFKIIREKLGIKDCIFYDNRATFMTKLYYSKVNDDTLTSLAGHQDIEITKQYYVMKDPDVILKNKRKAMAKVERLLVTPDMKKQLTQLS